MIFGLFSRICSSTARGPGFPASLLADSKRPTKARPAIALIRRESGGRDKSSIDAHPPTKAISPNTSAVSSLEPIYLRFAMVIERLTEPRSAIGCFDLEACRVEPVENPFGPKVFSMSAE